MADANNNIFSKDIGVYVDTSLTAVPSWKLAVCTTSKSLSVSVGSVAINNDCTGDAEVQLPSTYSWTMSFEGDVNTAPGVSELSAEQILGFTLARTVRKFKFESLDSTYVRYGLAMISQFDETASAPEYQTFSVSLLGSGDLLLAVPS